MKIYVVSNRPYITYVHGRKLYFELEKAKEMCEVLNKNRIVTREPNKWEVYEVVVGFKKR